ncbi:NAD(P)-bd-dom domain-containing protein [Fusarium falciforme]|uniref:NAD(P)-bd-dom domain-containing protein n=1 Tax=Fusarium falciforme TaxID=195108 RepID=UPI0023007917|nr:NAD(P)-bd-dom domain-containing protein [Fusarium falciforme]WAO89175.1 NAD(P)-bd-dom domain-containing protein [Fusarium falciforme]
MHIFLLGASGRNGSLILQSALKRGYTVTALVRNPSIFTNTSPNLTLVTGSPTSQPDLEVALQSPTPPDTVIFALGHRKTGTSPFAATAPDCPHDLMESSTKALLNAIKATNLIKQPKLIVNSSQGVGASMASLSAPIRFALNYSKALRTGLDDHTNVDALVRESGLPFVLARACRLTEGAVTTIRAWPDDGRGAPGWSAAVSRASVAEWLVDAVEGSDFDGKAPVLTN